MERAWTLATALHLVTVLPTVILGLAQFAMRKGTVWHRRAGWAYVVLMASTAVISFFIHEINQWNGLSWIHGLSLMMLYSLGQAIRNARLGRWDAHRGYMRGTFVGVVLAGIFASIPGRRLGDFLW